MGYSAENYRSVKELLEGRRKSAIAESDRRRDGTYAYYLSEPIVKNDAKGVAPLIMCYMEVKRLTHQA